MLVPTIAATNGRLLSLDVGGSGGLSIIALIDLCRATPLLEDIRYRYEYLTDDDARELGRLCPLLRIVVLLSEASSPAETWEKHFPNLCTMTLGGDTQFIGDIYRPTKLAAIAALAQTTKAHELDIDGCDVTLELIQLLVGTPFGDRVESMYITVQKYSLDARRGCP